MPVTDSAALFVAEDTPIIDVRSPSEFRRGHIPGASSVPLFSDEERAEVGLLYKQSGRDKAKTHGFEIASAKTEWLVEEIQKATAQSPFFLHCWRGGMRSGGVAWLCKDRGLKPTLLRGGYQAFRRHAHQQFERENKIIMLAGPTGVGKTRLLQSLREHGEQIIDLEALACHRGSVFGRMPSQPQPTVEQFENNLFAQWRVIDPQRPVWIEGESQMIGQAVIPSAFWQQMSAAPMLYVEADRECRIQFLIEEYGDIPEEQLIDSTQRLKKRLGGLRLKCALEAIEQRDWHTLGDILLQYYDKYYEKALKKRSQDTVQRFHLETPGKAANIDQLVTAGRHLLATSHRTTSPVH